MNEIDNKHKGELYCACGHRKALHVPRCSVCGCVVYHREDKAQREKRANRLNRNYKKLYYD